MQIHPLSTGFKFGLRIAWGQMVFLGRLAARLRRLTRAVRLAVARRARRASRARVNACVIQAIHSIHASAVRLVRLPRLALSELLSGRQAYDPSHKHTVDGTPPNNQKDQLNKLQN